MFLAAEMTLISRSGVAETPALKPRPFILIKPGGLMEGGRASDRAAEDGGAADQERRSSEAFAPFSRACSSTFKVRA